MNKKTLVILEFVVYLIFVFASIFMAVSISKLGFASVAGWIIVGIFFFEKAVRTFISLMFLRLPVEDRIKIMKYMAETIEREDED